MSQSKTKINVNLARGLPARPCGQARRAGKIPSHNILDLRKFRVVESRKEEKQEKRERQKNEKRERHESRERRFIFPAPAIIGFAVLILVFLLPLTVLASWNKLAVFKEQVLSLSQAALANFKEGASLSFKQEISQAQKKFQLAEEQFKAAQSELQENGGWLLRVGSILPQVASGKKLLAAGENLSAAALDLTQAFMTLQSLDVSNMKLTDGLVIAYASLRPAVEKLEQTNSLLAGVSLDDERVTLVTQAVPKISSGLRESLSLIETFLTVLGHQESKRYLVLFQNNHEIRPTGGFIGSLALLDIDQGEVKKIEIPGGGPYDLNTWLEEKVISPKPLHRVNPHWQIQDANWWPDFPTSAKKIQWFYEKSGGPSVDGVMTLTPNIIEELLKITGPIEISEYNLTVTSENFYQVTQTEAERKFDETTTPKKFIADLTPKLLNQVFSLKGGDLLKVLQVFWQALQQKDILFYFNDETLEKEVVARGWGGELKSGPQDYLMVVDTNIGGGKTDAAVEETIQMQTEILDDGSVIDTVTITRVHKGDPESAWENVNNWDYLRFYVPQGSEFISASGFTEPLAKDFFTPNEEYQLDEDLISISGETMIEETSNMRLSQELGKTVFGNWVETPVGKSSQVRIKYRLPFKLETSFWKTKADYQLYIQKQPGSFDPLVLNELQTDNWSITWQTANLNNSLETDLSFAAILQKK